jgi:ribosomal protein S18 acetylase RimI-like enzyme
MIRMTTPDDTEALLAVACASGMFEPHQVEELSGMLVQYFSTGPTGHELWITDDDGGPVGVAYTAPERMTDGTWNLYMIAIHPERQRQGRGKALLEYVEYLLTERGQRLLLVETSGTEDFDYVRTFYRNSGYSEEARIRDFYAAGVDKIIFRKVIGTLVVQDIKTAES